MKGEERKRELDYLLRKVLAYEEFFRRHKSPADFPCMSGAAKGSVEEGDLRWMRALGKEIDVSIRESMTASEQATLISIMSEFDVPLQHMPRTVSIKAIKTYLRRGRLNSVEEVSVANAMLDSQEARLLTKDELNDLGRLIDNFVVKPRKK